MEQGDDLRADDEALESEDDVQPVASRTKWLDGDMDDPEGVMDLAEGEDKHGGDLEEDVAEAESLDVRAIVGFERDAFDDWVRTAEDLQKRYGRSTLSADEINTELVKAHSSDPEVSTAAEDKLVRWNVKWIVKCLHRYAGTKVMSRPGPLREDLLSGGRWGFLTAIRKYNEEEAGRNGIRKASLLTFSDSWIRKYVSEILLKDHYGLNEEAALARKKVIRAREAIRSRTGREPGVRDIVTYLEAQARLQLEKMGVDSPTRKQLRQKGAMADARVKELLDHETNHASLDSPVGDEGGSSVGERIGALGDAALDLEQRDRMENLVEQVRRVPKHRYRRSFEMLNGLPVGQGQLESFSLAEVAVFLGKTGDTVKAYSEQVKRDIMGEEQVRASQLTWSMGGANVPESIMRDMARQVDLRRVMASEGLPVLDQETQTINCPISGGSMTVTSRSYTCSCCGEGDVFSWLVARRGLTPAKAIVEVGRMANRPPSVGSDVVTVTVDRARRERISSLR